MLLKFLPNFRRIAEKYTEAFEILYLYGSSVCKFAAKLAASSGYSPGKYHVRI